MGKLTTHVLDLVHGCPGGDIRVDLYCLNDVREHLQSGVTNQDGRIDQPLLEGESFVAGTYELIFQAGAYFKSKGIDQGEFGFLDEVVIRFGVADADQHYHVPLLLSRYGYSTYRGS